MDPLWRAFLDLCVYNWLFILRGSTVISSYVSMETWLWPACVLVRTSCQSLWLSLFVSPGSQAFYVILWHVLNGISIHRSAMEIIPVSTMFCGDYPCEHYLLWRLSLWALLLYSMTHYDITMGSGIARDVHCSNELCCCYVYISWHHNA